MRGAARRAAVALLAVVASVALLLAWLQPAAVEVVPVQENVAGSLVRDTPLPAAAVVDPDDGEAYARARCVSPCVLRVVEHEGQVAALRDKMRTGDMVLLKSASPEQDSWRTAVEDMWLATAAVHSAPQRSSWVLGRRVVPVENTSREAFYRDRKSPEYSPSARKWSAEAYALLVQPPMDEHMYDMARTAVFTLRRLDPTRDVAVVLVRLSDKESDIVARLKRDFTALGAIVFEREPLPVRPVDKQMYYRFDYQKMFIWNLPHSKIMFIDSDMVVLASPARGFEICSGRKYAVCAVQEIRNYGGYFNNGFFVLVRAWRREEEELLRVWWKPSAPWRQICLQDLMNEVYARKWQAMPEAFNVQTVKQGILGDSWKHAILLHYKDCHATRDTPFCAVHWDNHRLMTEHLAKQKGS